MNGTAIGDGVAEPPPLRPDHLGISSMVGAYSYFRRIHTRASVSPAAVHIARLSLIMSATMSNVPLPWNLQLGGRQWLLIASTPLFDR